MVYVSPFSSAVQPVHLLFICRLDHLHVTGPFCAYCPGHWWWKGFLRRAAPAGPWARRRHYDVRYRCPDGRDYPSMPLLLKDPTWSTHILPQFCILSADFLFRFYWNKPVRSMASDSQANSDTPLSTSASSEKDLPTFPAKLRLMLHGVGIVTVWVLIRSIYRTIELAGGWTGPIITTQVYFNVFDGAPIFLAMFTLNLFHPGWLLLE